MKQIPGLRNLILAAAAAVITTAGAVIVLLQPEDGTRKITGTVAAAPGLGWSVDAVELAGRASAEFQDPIGGTEFNLGYPGFVDTGDTLVTVIGASEEERFQHEPILVGIDETTGARRWQAPAADLGGCGATPVDGQLVCFSSRNEMLIGYDIDTGKVTHTPTDWYIFAMATVDDRVYVAEGDVESDDVRVHSGTLDDPDAYWSRAFNMGASWEDLPYDALDVSHGQGVFTLGGDVAGFDLTSGNQTWSAELNGCSEATATSGAVTVRLRNECRGDHPITGSDLLDRTGRSIATTNSAAVHSLSIDRPTDDTIPVLLGDSAYDRRTGNLMWTNPDLIGTPHEADPPATLRGTVVAILGDIAVLRDDVARTTTALDLRTGHRLWRVETERFATILGGDERAVVFTDATGLWAVESRTGATIWDIPFRAVNAEYDALTGDGQLAVHTSGRYTYASSRTIIGLRPLNH